MCPSYNPLHSHNVPIGHMQVQFNQSVPHPSSTSSSKLPKHIQHTLGSKLSLTVSFNPVRLTAKVIFSSVAPIADVDEKFLTL